MPDRPLRLKKFLADNGEPMRMAHLTPDASTREYFRVEWRGGPAIACVYPEPFAANEQNCLDTTQLFLAAGLPVARVLAFDAAAGVIVLEDLGDAILRDAMLAAEPAESERLTLAAIDLIPRIQAATPLAFEMDSVASRLRFDTEKLLWELDFFKEHYFGTFKKRPLDESVDAAIDREFAALSADLEQRARVLCHRDFHAANLMIAENGSLRIIDHQDARIGPASYDLVSLLLDRVTAAPPPEWLAKKRRYFLQQRVAMGLEAIDESDFADEFRLQTIQRCLKAVGTFSFQSVNRGKSYFVQFISPMFEIVLRALENLDRFPTLARVLAAEEDRNRDPD